MKSRQSILLLLLLFVGKVSSAQFQKGDWLIDANLDNESFVSNLTSQYLTNERVAWNNKIGRFLSDDFLLGLGYGLSTQSLTAQSLNNDSYYENNFQHQTINAFARYYMPGKNLRRALFISGDFQYQYNKEFQFSNIGNNQTIKKHIYQFNAGIGISLFHLPHTALEFFVDYDVFNMWFEERRNQIELDKGEIRFHFRVQRYLNKNWKTKWPSKTSEFLQKGRRLVGGQIDYNFMERELNHILDLNGYWLYFLSKKWCVGTSLPLNVIFRDQHIRFSYGIGPTVRYYQGVSSRLQIFGHFALTNSYAGDIYWEGNRSSGFHVAAFSNLDTTFGIGMNFFLSPNTSIYWLYKYEVFQRIKEYHFNYWDKSRTQTDLEMGLAFFF